MNKIIQLAALSAALVIAGCGGGDGYYGPSGGSSTTPSGSSGTPSSGPITTVTSPATTPSLTIGLNNTSTTSGNNVYYLQSLSISVVDQTGKPLANQVVNVSVVPSRFHKGFLKFFPATAGTPATPTTPAIPATLASWPQVAISQASATGAGYVPKATDVFISNYSGFLESPLICPLISGPVINNPVSLLDASPTTQIASYTTDKTGKLDFSIRYAKAYAEWLEVKLTATTTFTQNPNTPANTSTSSMTFDLRSLVTDFDLTGATRPPNLISPHGIVKDCSNLD